MLITRNQENYQSRLIKMLNEVLADRALHSLLAKKAIIFSPEYIAEDGCLWITGTGVFSSYRSMFVSIEQLNFDAIRVSVTLTDDDSGRTNFLIWGYGDSQDRAAISQMLVFLIEDILSGRGERVTVR